jgi:catalase
VRGFSVKFFTEEGNHDIVGNHIVGFSFAIHAWLLF